MKANELITHCFVYFNCFDGSKITVRVTGFQDEIVYGDSKTGSHWCNIEKVEPISLTEEILKKNGFVKVENTKTSTIVYSFRDSLFRIEIYDFEHVTIDSIYTDSMYDGFISDVHELQHALRLCGINKEIIV